MGQFKDNKIHGSGTMYFRNGNEYRGEWSDGAMNGYGTLGYADGTLGKAKLFAYYC